MRPRFLADADLRFAIVSGLRKREPAVDFLAAQGLIRESMEDPDVLSLAVDLRRVLVSHDFETMPSHFYGFLESRESPGLILIPESLPLGYAVGDVQIVWLAKMLRTSEPDHLSSLVTGKPVAGYLFPISGRQEGAFECMNALQSSSAAGALPDQQRAPESVVR